MKLYVATSNAGKLRDFRIAAQATSGFELEALPGLAGISAPPEEEPTFEGNARSKAAFYSQYAPGYWVLADDSGLEVDALDGRPGVRSARFAQDVGFASSGDIDAANNEALLLAMTEVTDRSARYRCALALAMDGEVEQVSFGTLEGRILTEPQGASGFGYDPYFFATELNCSMAEADEDRRLEVSHRGRALRALLRSRKPC